MSQINAAATSARESARSADGKFGSYSTPEAEDVDLTREARDYLERKPGDVDDFTQDHFAHVQPLTAKLPTPGSVLTLNENFHGDASLGEVKVARDGDGAARATVRPRVDVTSVAPAGLDEDAAGDWAGLHSENFDTFVEERYGLDPSSAYTDAHMDAIEYEATATMPLDTHTEDVARELHRQHPGLQAMAQEFDDGTVSSAYDSFLASDQEPAAPQ